MSSPTVDERVEWIGRQVRAATSQAEQERDKAIAQRDELAQWLIHNFQCQCRGITEIKECVLCQARKYVSN